MPTLSAEVAALYGEANQAYGSGDFDTAIPLFRQVTKIEPYVKGAWESLAMCLQEIGQEQEALRVEMIAAHLGTHNLETWKDLGSRSRYDCHIRDITSASALKRAILEHMDSGSRPSIATNKSLNSTNMTLMPCMNAQLFSKSSANLNGSVSLPLKYGGV